MCVGVELTWPIIYSNEWPDGEMLSGHIYRVAIIRILVIDDMCVVKGVHLATSAKSPNELCL
jgi:hypothetical protein